MNDAPPHLNIYGGCGRRLCMKDYLRQRISRYGLRPPAELISHHPNTARNGNSADHSQGYRGTGEYALLFQDKMLALALLRCA